MEINYKDIHLKNFSVGEMYFVMFINIQSKIQV
jgi:hypothetical protein